MVTHGAIGCALLDGALAETGQETADEVRQQMHTQSKHRNVALSPVIVAVIVAIASTAGILFDDFGPSSTSRDRAMARMITAAALSRAGAIETPSEPFVNPPTSPPV